MASSQTPNPAEAYERFQAQMLFVPWTRDLIRRASPKRGETVLDLACGTGIVTRSVASLVGPQGKVVGLDISPAMLEVASKLAPKEGAVLEWREGSGTEMPLDDASFDLVLCQQGLQFFPDHQAGLNEMWRVLAPGGRALVSAWRPLEEQPFMMAIDNVLSTHVMPGALSLPFSLNDETVLENLAKTAGFKKVEVQQASLTIRVGEPDAFAPMVLQGAAAVLPEFAAIPVEERQSLIERMKADLDLAVQPFVQGDHLVMDTATNVLVAWR